MEICECLCIICSSTNNNNAGCIPCCQLYDDNIKDHKNRRLRFLPLIFALLFCIVAVIICPIEYALYSTNNSVKTILDNWRKNQIQQIYLTDTCDEHNILSSYTVPQITIGCLCGKYVYSTQCSSTQLIFESCNEISGDDAFSFNYWAQQLSNGSYAPYYICQKIGSQNYFNQLQSGLRSKYDCSNAQMKICETTDASIFTCVQQNEDCPITNIIIQSTPLSQEYLNTNYWEPQNYSTDFYVYVSRIAPQRPIILGKVIKGKGQCLVPNQLSLNQNYSSDYALNYPQAKDCVIDQRYKSITQTLETQLLYHNNVLDKFRKTRVGYPLQFDIMYQFMVMNQIYLNDNCETIIIDDLIEVSDNLDFIDSLLIVQLILSIIYFCAINFYFFNELALCCYSIKQIPKMTYLITRWLFQYGFSFIIYFIYAYLVISEKIIVKLIKNNCFEEITQDSLQSVIDNSIQSSKSLSVSLLIMIIILSIIEIIFALFRIVRLYQKIYRIKLREKINQEKMQKQQAKYIDVQMVDQPNFQNTQFQQEHVKYY